MVMGNWTSLAATLAELLWRLVKARNLGEIRNVPCDSASTELVCLFIRLATKSMTLVSHLESFVAISEGSFSSQISQNNFVSLLMHPCLNVIVLKAWRARWCREVAAIRRCVGAIRVGSSSSGLPSTKQGFTSSQDRMRRSGIGFPSKVTEVQAVRKWGYQTNYSLPLTAN